jgi:hypothetical protein
MFEFKKIAYSFSICTVNILVYVVVLPVLYVYDKFRFINKFNGPFLSKKFFMHKVGRKLFLGSIRIRTGTCTI